MAIEGPLKELNIHDVFQLLDLGRKTGVLRITSELRQNSGVVFFERGAVIAAQIASNPHPLGEVLLKQGKLREEDLARARAMQAAGDRRRLGEILTAIGAIGRRELERCVRAQVEEVVFELLSWSEGYFSFTDGAADRAALEATASIPTEALMMEAARRIDEWSRIATKVPHLGVIPRLRAPEDGGGAPLDLVPFEWEVLAAVDGRRDVRTIAQELSRSEFDVARTLYGLGAAGVIALDEPRPSANGADAAPNLEEHLSLARTALAVGDYAEAETALRQMIGFAPEHPTPHRLLGLALAGLARYGEALESWEAWTRLASQHPAEEQHAAEIARLRQAAGVLAEALRGRDG
jgi:tetratricopeptide (TPR) repeat protein